MATEEFTIKEVTAEQMAELRRIAREEERCDRVEWYVNYDEYPIYRLRGPEPTKREVRYGLPTLYFYDDDAGEWRGVAMVTAFECVAQRRAQDEAAGLLKPLTAEDWAAAKRTAMAELQRMVADRPNEDFKYYVDFVGHPLYHVYRTDVTPGGKKGLPWLCWYNERGKVYEIDGDSTLMAMGLAYNRDQMAHKLAVNQQPVNA